jgi:hypothetical protein
MQSRVPETLRSWPKAGSRWDREGRHGGRFGHLAGSIKLIPETIFSGDGFRNPFPLLNRSKSQLDAHMMKVDAGEVADGQDSCSALPCSWSSVLQEKKVERTSLRVAVGPTVFIRDRDFCVPTWQPVAFLFHQLCEIRTAESFIVSTQDSGRRKGRRVLSSWHHTAGDDDAMDAVCNRLIHAMGF